MLISAKGDVISTHYNFTTIPNWLVAETGALLGYMDNQTNSRGYLYSDKTLRMSQYFADPTSRTSIVVTLYTNDKLDYFIEFGTENDKCLSALHSTPTKPTSYTGWVKVGSIVTPWEPGGILNIKGLGYVNFDATGKFLLVESDTSINTKNGLLVFDSDTLHTRLKVAKNEAAIATITSSYKAKYVSR